MTGTRSWRPDDSALVTTGPSPCPPVQPGDPAQIQYTSGTTGFPKGAILHHRGVVNASRFVALGSGVQDGGVWVNAMPMFHIGGGTLTELGTIAQRGTYVLLPGFDPGLVLELIEAYRGTIMLAVPTMLLALLEQPGLAARDLSSLRTVMSGAAVRAGRAGAPGHGDVRLPVHDRVRPDRTARGHLPDPAGRQRRKTSPRRSGGRCRRSR